MELEEKIKDEAKRFRKEVRKKTISAILAAFAFVMALVWRDAIQEAADRVLETLGLTGSAYIYKIITALVVTVICVIGIIIFSRWEGEKSKK